MLRRTAVAGLALALCALAPRADAQTFVEIDPLAYTVLRGYSGHVGRVFGPARVEIGAFGARIPDALERNEGWSSRMRGAGVNVDYLGGAGGTRSGAFVGVGAGAGRHRFTLDSTGGAATQTRWSTGVRAGYRWFPARATRLYVQPWASLDYALNAKPVVVAGKRFEESRWQFFPTVHLGWRF